MKTWFKNLFKKKKNEFPFHVQKVGNQIMLYDDQMKAYMESTLPNPVQSDLDRLSTLTRHVIISINTFHKKSKKLVPQKLLEISDAPTIQDFFSCLEIVEPAKGHIMCVGTYLIDLIEGNGKVHHLEYLGFGSIRWAATWKDDANLINPEDLMQWLADQGINEPLEQWLEDKEQTIESNQRFESWIALAPPSLPFYIDELDQNPVDHNCEHIFQALKKDIPDEFELILKLFGLYGHQFHRWNGVPVYEFLPAQVLLSIDIKKLVEAFTHTPLTSEQKEGMARFLSDWDFHQKRKSDLNEIPADVKNMLLEHVLAQGDEEKINTFRRRVLD